MWKCSFYLTAVPGHYCSQVQATLLGDPLTVRCQQTVTKQKYQAMQASLKKCSIQAFQGTCPRLTNVTFEHSTVDRQASTSCLMSPILSWPRIMFSKRLSYDFFNCRHKYLKIAYLESLTNRVFELLIEHFKSSGWYFPSFPCFPGSQILLNVFQFRIARFHNLWSPVNRLRQASNNAI